MRILLADDHAVVRRGLRQILADEFPDAIFAEAGNAGEVIEFASKDEWSCIVLDITMPGRSGLEALRELKQFLPKVPVLVLSAHSEDQYALRVLKVGASGYLTKDHAPEELVKAVKKVISGGKYITPALAEKLAEKLRGDPNRAPHELLSDREFQVLRMIASGLPIKKIAAELSLSEKTVSTYHTRLFEKMELHSDAELVRYALEHRLVS
jgi:DNA-binding NarL/FixJ family response regulator